MERYLKKQVLQDLDRKMVFVGGARQVGKTTLAKTILRDDRGYLSWDIVEHRDNILRHNFPVTELIVFDEIHKYRTWRNYLKGIYDNPSRKFKILVIGSARLDIYRFGGDSLQGRYHFLRLHPLSVAELGIQSQEDFITLLNLGGFPEPFFGGSEIEAKRWSKEYRSRLVREDINSLERVEDLGNIELMMTRLPELVGSPLSINSLREDLQIGHKTAAKWLNILERLYAIFRLSPFGSPKIKAVKKEQKHYHFDWSLVKDPSLRFENLVACHLLKWVNYEEDTKGRDIELRYLRDITAREVDFVIVEDKKPLMLIECKWNDVSISPALIYFKKRFPQAEAYQISAVGEKDYQNEDGIRVCNWRQFLGKFI